MKNKFLFLILCAVLLAGCADTAASSTNAASAIPSEAGDTIFVNELRSHEALRYPGSQSDPETALEVLKPSPQTKTCPVCGGSEIRVELASKDVIHTEGEEIDCIHSYWGSDLGDFDKMLLRDVCQNCTDPAAPWTSEEYEMIIGGTLYCYGY